VNLRSPLGRWHRYRLRHATNAPYLSGDLFRSMADVAIDVIEAGDESRWPARVADARVIFVKTDALGAFVAHVAPAARRCRVLITGNSDLEVHQVPAPLPPSLACWFAQNTFVVTDRLQPLPIGLENAALGHHGRPSLFRRRPGLAIRGRHLRVFAAFGPTTPERHGLLDRLGRAPVVAPARRLSPARFQAALRAHRFVLAPRGNGVDTHRFWEALYADAIPVTRASAWSRAIRAAGLPLIEVDDWDEILSWTEADLARWSAEQPDQPSANPWLWEPFWRDRIATLAST
jgi:hypothetical protein